MAKQVNTITVNDNEKKKVGDLIRRYATLNNRKKKIEAEMDEIKDAIMDIIRSYDPEGKIISGSHSAMISTRTRTYVSYAELAEAHPRIASKFAKVSESSALIVK